ncbi:glycosyltransferase family 4 protein [Agrobacterium rosae]|uniref:glycosyltransferase family 4 protein n=1 Tax=Agrobacterium rosae TaxID=1972867 RepID=UPI002A0DF66E|nr:glycosyltransferase family 4 protein [Agrobacterium rosae]MDX8314577.1 glycosyltransferase family 4 protein [Agrobacterium rosae]
MKIAFYCPLKSPNHPVPSGDRLMARLLMRAMRLAGHEVEVVSELRSFLRQPSGDDVESLKREAQAERKRIAADWLRDGKPDIWFCYHPYYKARDFLGPELCQLYGVAYVTAEASYSPKRDKMGWAETQAGLLTDLRFAAINICFTQRDRDGLTEADADIRCTMLPPFIDASAFTMATPSPTRYRMATVAMMRAGDKLGSYQALADALTRLPRDLPWTLDIIGDGPERETVHRTFGAIDRSRLIWHGERNTADIANILSHASIYVWPGHGEAYGLAYLEAQAAGLPVVAERIAGVPEVVRHGETGILTEPGDTGGYADALASLMTDDDMRRSMAETARRFATTERSLENAAATLNTILTHLPEHAS